MDVASQARLKIVNRERPSSKPRWTEPSRAEPEPKVQDRLSRAGMLLLQGFATHPTYYAPKIFV
jgi:hypothetical protein